ncbi:hypothetical protein MNBD_CHLOROFLEXI01-4148 [hydrothermal vent metagenome]|uniref:Uncharacterized protein n=1 Tax=hydrothermal vent metagenome TaxID=652676 RepID=A0A3B0VTH2_9ZZZZ
MNIGQTLGQLKVLGILRFTQNDSLGVIRYLLRKSPVQLLYFYKS